MALFIFNIIFYNTLINNLDILELPQFYQNFIFYQRGEMRLGMRNSLKHMYKIGSRSNVKAR